MEREVALELVTATLERAADQLGDITGRVIDLYYSRHPTVHERFEFHDPCRPDRLQGTMVEQVLFCMLRLHESPGEVEIILMTTIPHHIETLGVSGELFDDLLVATTEVVAGTIPAEAEDERRAWNELVQSLLEICATGATYARPDLVRQVA